VDFDLASFLFGLTCGFGVTGVFLLSLVFVLGVSRTRKGK
jgi:hypothetical protein